MPSERPSTPRFEAWKYGLLGGIVSIPLTVGAYWATGMGNEFSLNLVVVGGLLVGYLAEKRDLAVGSDAVGLRAGVVGGVPGVVWLLWARFVPAGVGSVTRPSAVEAATVLLVAVFGLGIGALVGLVGGAIGGWLARKVGGGRPEPVGS